MVARIAQQKLDCKTEYVSKVIVKVADLNIF
jgi:hypothetical protein